MCFFPKAQEPSVSKMTHNTKGLKLDETPTAGSNKRTRLDSKQDHEVSDDLSVSSQGTCPPDDGPVPSLRPGMTLVMHLKRNGTPTFKVSPL